MGLDHPDHAGETESEIPERPRLCSREPNALATHGDTTSPPEGNEWVDHGAGVGVVIGEQCRNVFKDRAEEVVANPERVPDNAEMTLPVDAEEKRHSSMTT